MTPIERMAMAAYSNGPNRDRSSWLRLAEPTRERMTSDMIAALRELRDNPPVQLMGSMTRDFALCISAILAEHEAAHD